jgi:KDO2-lipid IV(A) lauroyltransferase
MVALMCDLPPPGAGGVEVDFFGKRAVGPSGPAAIAIKRQVPLLPAYCRRDGPGHYHVHVDPPLPPPAATVGGHREASAAMMQQVMRRFERFIGDHPDQWYAFKQVVT